LKDAWATARDYETISNILIDNLGQGSLDESKYNENFLK